MNIFEKWIESIYLRIKDNKVYYDMVTGTRSRYYYDTVIREKYLEEEILLVYVDIDNLKVINDTEGHQAGTELIKRVSSDLLSKEGVLDVCRIGGDEFVMFFCKYYNLENLRLPVECSYGINYKEKWEDISSVVSKAECNMYKMKRTK